MDTPEIDIRSIVARNINRLLNETKRTRQEVCNDLNIKYTTFCDWLNGNSSPKLESLEAISRYFGIAIGDLFVDLDDPGDIGARLSAYTSRAVALDMSVLDYLTDEQVNELLKKGFSFKHKSLEEYIAESGKKLKAYPEFDWGLPVGGEVW
ncbi:MAG: helix-turn-helix transcriptional regulator [Lachnospiraceae bacterium]|nr:helix-turn-helix transcriptional regulator [Lachnospiraceae bacterium]